MATLLVVARPHWPMWTVEEFRSALGLTAQSEASFQRIEIPLIDLASRELRRRVAEGRSLRYQVPRAVECYIETHQLYAE
jgi:nicotinate-nucleotide adenylyltransferase